LNDVVRVQPAGQGRGTFPPRQGAQPVGVADIEQAGSIAIAVLKSFQQAAVGKWAVAFRRAIGVRLNDVGEVHEPRS